MCAVVDDDTAGRERADTTRARRFDAGGGVEDRAHDVRPWVTMGVYYRDTCVGWRPSRAHAGSRVRVRPVSRLGLRGPRWGVYRADYAGRLALGVGNSEAGMLRMGAERGGMGPGVVVSLIRDASMASADEMGMSENVMRRLAWCWYHVVDELTGLTESCSLKKQLGDRE